MPIKYIGSKRTLVTLIADVIAERLESGTVLDLFSGTARVGYELKRRGYRVLANDHNAYAATIARCYIEADREDWHQDATRLIEELNAIEGDPGYFTTTFCEKSRFVHPKNGARIDAIRTRIEELSLHADLKSILLVALMEAADRVDSTTGVQMAYLKNWAARAQNDLNLRVPDLLPRAGSGKGAAFSLDALEACNQLSADLAYLDPPYNQHSYLGNYHVWESLVLWDKPEVYGKACKRVDCRERRSVFNSRPRFREVFSQVVHAVNARWLVVSFNNEGYMNREDMEDLLRERGPVTVIESDYARYVGAKIGIYDLKGKKVGLVSHLRNKEYLYVVGPLR